MKNTINLLFILFIVSLCLSCSSDKRAEAFVGEWQSVKKPTESWKISQSMGKYTGTRTGAADFYKMDTESWEVNTDQSVIRLINKTEGGSTLSYFPNKDQIMRTPPGIIYKRKK